MKEYKSHILGVKIDLLTYKQIFDIVEKYLFEQQCHHIVTLNPEICLKAEKNDYYKKIINRAAITIADGFGLTIGALILGTQKSKRMPGRVFLDKLFNLALIHKKSIFLLGGKPSIAQKAKHALEKSYPGLQIVGAEEGIRAESFSTNNKDLINRINQSKADILLVAFGAPKQEFFIHDNKSHLKTIKIAIGVGGIFDYLAGEVPTPSEFVQAIGLEWLFRLFTQKRRLRRVIDATVVFLLTCIKWRLRMMFVYRKNVVGLIRDNKDKILLVTPTWSKDIHWQFPQGGVDRGESEDQAFLREMNEELGTNKIIIQERHPRIHKYKWPKWYKLLRGYKGQKQDLFIAKFTGKENDIDLEKEGELKQVIWVEKDRVLSLLNSVRKKIGKKALQKLDA